jgi:opacity protein-like surface antigen
MMNRLRIGGLALFLLTCGASSSAADDSPLIFYAGLGAVKQDGIEGGTPILAAGFEYDRIPYLALGLLFSRFSNEDQFEGTRSTTSVELYGRVHPLHGQVRPFAELGLGRYLLDDGFDSDTRSGWLGGLGLEVLLNTRTSLSLTARYHSVDRPEFSTPPDFEEIQLGFRHRLGGHGTP